MGVASMRFFDSNGSLAMGLQKRPFLFTNKLPFSWNPAAPPSGKEPGEDGVWCDGRRGPWGDDECSNDDVCKEDWGFRLERVSSPARHNAKRTDGRNVLAVFTQRISSSSSGVGSSSRSSRRRRFA